MSEQEGESDDHPREEPSTSRVVGSVAWAGTSAVLGQAIQFISFIAITRVLTPSQVGLGTIALTVALFGQLFTDLGLSAAIIKQRHLTQSYVATSFLINAWSGLVVTLIIVAISVPVSKIFHAPSLILLISVASLTFLLSVGSVPLALLIRQFRFKTITKIEVASAVIAAALGITASRNGFGATSVLIAPIVSVLISSICACYTVRIPLRHLYSHADARDIVKYVRGIVGFSTLNYWSRNADNLIVAGIASPTVLGYYGRAYQLMLAPLTLVADVISRVLFPVLSVNAANEERFRSAWSSAIGAAMLIGCPFAAFMVMDGRDIAIVLLGQKWAPCGFFISVLAASLPAQLFSRFSGVVYQSLQVTGLYFRMGIVGIVVTVGGMLVGIAWGAHGVTVGASAGLTITACVVGEILCRLTRTSRLQLLKVLLRPVLSAGVSLVPAIYFRDFVGASAWIGLIDSGGLFLAIYTVCTWKGGDASIVRVFSRLRNAGRV